MHTIIGISGPKRSGKDFCYQIIRAHYIGQKPVIRLAFADALKREVCGALCISRQLLENDKEHYRPILQWWGTEFRRRNSPQYWITKWLEACETIRREAGDVVIVAPDVRFLNEAATIKDVGGLLLVVYPHNNPQSLPDSHQSETELSKIKADHNIDNDFLSPETTVKQIQNIIK